MSQRYCPHCGKITDTKAKNSSLCRKCSREYKAKWREKRGKEKCNNWYRNWRELKGEAYRKERMRADLDAYHKKISSMTSEEKKNFYKIRSDKAKEKYKKLKEVVYEHYGKLCACCGESEEDFLTIDHVNDDGNEHRREIGAQSIALIRWIIKNKFPSNIQILCWNCQWGKRKNNGRCPHSKK